MAEFVSTKLVSDMIIILPFFATFGFHPRLDFELDIRTNISEEVLR
jgi:hypothetical protein